MLRIRLEKVAAPHVSVARPDEGLAPCPTLNRRTVVSRRLSAPTPHPALRATFSRKGRRESAYAAMNSFHLRTM